MPAFARALELGADGVELDVRTSGSGDVVVCHDAHLGRLGGRSAFVAQLPTSYLRTIDLGGACIPTLDEVIDLLAPHKRINIEVKGDVPDRRGTARAVAHLLARRSKSVRDALFLSTFDPVVLLTLRVSTTVPVALLFDAKGTGMRRAAFGIYTMRPQGVHPHHPLCTPERVAAWKKRGLFVNAWTVNDPDRAIQLVNCNIDGIITDDVAGLRRALQSRVSV
jgi:glycerophosphoryl diester phosphodiesterase